MQRGSRKIAQLTQSLFPEECSPEVDEKTLYEDKVQAICARYIYYVMQAKERKITYPDILKILEKEFWISSRRVADIICNNAPEIQKLRTNPPKKSSYQQHWSHINW